MRIIIAAGGSGGHMFPALAVANQLRRLSDDNQILFVGTNKQIEQDILLKTGFGHAAVSSRPILGKGLLNSLLFLLTLPYVIFQCFLIFKKFKPDVVVGFGGYPSFVPLLSAWIFCIPRALQEQNVKVGLANKIASAFVNEVYAVHGAKGFKCKKVIEISNPVREEFYKSVPYTLPSKGQKFNLAVCGGSQGAMALNEAICSLSPLLSEFDVALTHQTGKLDIKRMQEWYKQSDFTPEILVPFIQDMAQVYKSAHLVITRAGAMTVAEITASGRPAIYVPLPIAGGHQADNVSYVVEKGAAAVVQQNQEFVDNLSAVLRDYLENPEKLTMMAAKCKAMNDSSQETPAQAIARYIGILAS